MRRVDVQEHRPVVERHHTFRPQLPELDLGQQSSHFQIPGLDPAPDCFGAARGVQRAEWLEPSRRPRNHGVNLVTGPELDRERLEQRRCHKRQIAGQHDDAMMFGIHESGVHAAERTSARDPIGNDAHSERRIPRRIVAHDAHVVGDRRERCQLAFDDARATDDERGLVGASESSGAAAGEDRRGDLTHNRRYHTAVGPIERR